MPSYINQRSRPSLPVPSNTTEERLGSHSAMPPQNTPFPVRKHTNEGGRSFSSIRSVWSTPCWTSATEVVCLVYFVSRAQRTKENQSPQATKQADGYLATECAAISIAARILARV